METKRTFRIETLGCKVNEYESAFYTEQLEQAGLQAAENGEKADVIVINTCTVTNTAAAKSRRKIARLRRENPGAFCAVAGCYVQVSTPQEREAFGADLLVGAAHKNELAKRIVDALNHREADAGTNITESGESVLEQRESAKGMDLVDEAGDLTAFESMPIGHFEGQHRAFLKIQDGCNQYCAYCQIPLARGPERSQIPDEVVSSAVSLAEDGHLEIVLTGIHTGRYHFRGTNLTDLLRRLLEETPEEVCYRLSSIEITEVTDELLELMAENPRILPHLHIPIQSGCDATLNRMKRPYSVEQFQTRLQQIRDRIPQISISTDVIAGFVGESDEEFARTKQTLEECAFSFLHVFPYSRRKGTAADAMSGFIAPDVAKARTEELLELSKTLREQDMERFEESQALIEREDPRHPGVYLGYTSQYHPVQIYHASPLHGRVNVRMTGNADGRYTAVIRENL